MIDIIVLVCLSIIYTFMNNMINMINISEKNNEKGDEKSIENIITQILVLLFVISSIFLIESPGIKIIITLVYLKYIKFVHFL